MPLSYPTIICSGIVFPVNVEMSGQGFLLPLSSFSAMTSKIWTSEIISRKQYLRQQPSHKLIPAARRPARFLHTSLSALYADTQMWSLSLWAFLGHVPFGTYVWLTARWSECVSMLVSSSNSKMHAFLVDNSCTNSSLQLKGFKINCCHQGYIIINCKTTSLTWFVCTLHWHYCCSCGIINGNYPSVNTQNTQKTHMLHPNSQTVFTM